MKNNIGPFNVPGYEWNDESYKRLLEEETQRRLNEYLDSLADEDEKDRIVKHSYDEHAALLKAMTVADEGVAEELEIHKEDTLSELYLKYAATYNNVTIVNPVKKEIETERVVEEKRSIQVDNPSE